jgi:sarcosine oxidase, subunit beta
VIIGRANPDDTGWSAGGIDWDWLEPTMHAAATRFPWIADLPLDTKASWWGYSELTPDHFPILGVMPDTDGWLNACGFSGHGVMQAAATGRVIAQEAVGERTIVDIRVLRIDRFSDPGNAQHDITL